MKYFLMSICLCLGMISCKNNSEVKRDAAKKVIAETENYSPLDKNARYVATSQGLLDGKIIRNSKLAYSTVIEYDSLRNLLNTTVVSSGIKLVSHFNQEGVEREFTRYTKGEMDIFQKNKFTERGDLLEEFRIEKNENKFDTTLYEYHYQYRSKSKDYIMHRTNNKDTVTKYIVKYKGNKEYKSEQAHPNDRFFLHNNYVSTFNESDKPIETIRTSIYKDMGTEKYDTTEYKSTFEYNTDGLLISEMNFDNILKPSKVLFKYEDGIISEKMLGNQLLKFNLLELEGQ